MLSMTSLVIDSCHGLGRGQGSADWWVTWVTGHKIWPIVSSVWMETLWENEGFNVSVTRHCCGNRPFIATDCMVWVPR